MRLLGCSLMGLTPPSLGWEQLPWREGWESQGAGGVEITALAHKALQQALQLALQPTSYKLQVAFVGVHAEESGAKVFQFLTLPPVLDHRRDTLKQEATK